jgi:uncharacterized protein YdcH (DUF465 family)
MFEHQQKDHIDAVMKANPEFRRLYLHHQELDSKVRDAELGVLPMHDTELHGMKKEADVEGQTHPDVEPDRQRLTRCISRRILAGPPRAGRFAVGDALPCTAHQNQAAASLPCASVPVQEPPHAS